MTLNIRMEQDGDRSQVRALWETCFDDSASFLNWFFRDRWMPAYGVVAEEDGRIVSAMQGYPYVLSIRGKPVRATMLAGVSTQPDCRGRGLMPKGLALFTAMAARRGEDVVFHTPAHHTTFFKCLNYSASKTAFVRSDGNPAAAMPKGLRDTAANPSLADALLPVYTRAMAAYSGAVSRSKADMALKLADYGSDGGRVLVYPGEDGTIAGYTVYLVGEDGAIWAEEFAAVDASVRDALLFGLLAAGEGRAVCAKLPPDRAQRLPADFCAEILPTGAMGAANVPALLRTLAGFGDLTVEVSDPMVPANAGVFTFAGEPASRSADVSMDAGRLMQLLSGYASIGELAADGSAQIQNPRALELLAQRLKPQTCYVVEEY